MSERSERTSKHSALDGVAASAASGVAEAHRSAAGGLRVDGTRSTLADDQ
jgi:hypothetical protein